MKKVLLIFPKLDRYKDAHHLPVSLLAIAAPLEAHAIDYEIFDERVENYEDLPKRLKGVAIVGITMFTGYQTFRGYEILKLIRSLNKEIIIVAGGPHVTNLQAQTLESNLVDYVVAGYGEESFLTLTKDLLKNGTLTDTTIVGLAFRTPEGKTIVNPPTRGVSSDFWHPIPYHKIDVKKYINPKTELVMYVSTYGCPAACTFCATPTQRRWTPRPMELVYKDIDTLYEAYPFKHFIFNDATLFTSKSRMMETISYLKKFNVSWEAFGRATEITGRYSPEDLEKITNLGGRLDHVTVGLESGSKLIAEKVMKKGDNHLEKFKSCIKSLAAAKIEVHSGLIFGIPGDKVSDVQATIDYISEIREIDPRFKISSSFFRPLPGTDLYDELFAKGYPFPKSFEEWAKLADSNHYSYNEWLDVPWMEDKDKPAYRKIYDRFHEIHGEILV